MSESNFTISCWGCNYSETHPWNGLGLKYDTTIEEMKSRGWARRTFAPGAAPWFCSYDCAFYSLNAKQAEQLWADEEFKKVCDKQIIHPQYYGLLTIIAFVGILILAALFGECIHAR